MIPYVVCGFSVADKYYLISERLSKNYWNHFYISSKYLGKEFPFITLKVTSFIISDFIFFI